MMGPCDCLVVGAGFAGAVAAERLASIFGWRILVVDRREYLGGNAFDRHDSVGILVHEHGPHIFHTNSRRIFEYLSRFTEWRCYEHRVLANVDGELVPFPVNATTIHKLYGVRLEGSGLAAWLASRAEPREVIRNA